MRIQSDGITFKAEKQEDSNHPSGADIVKGVQDHFDQFQNNPRASAYDDLVDRAKNFTLTPSDSGLPEIIGKANEPNIPEEALDRLRQQVADAQNKSNKKA